VTYQPEEKDDFNRNICFPIFIEITYLQMLDLPIAESVICINHHDVPPFHLTNPYNLNTEVLTSDIDVAPVCTGLFPYPHHITDQTRIICVLPGGAGTPPCINNLA